MTTNKRCVRCSLETKRELGSIYSDTKFECYTCQILRMPNKLEEQWYREVYGFGLPMQRKTF
jgi:hypothetical protein